MFSFFKNRRSVGKTIRNGYLDSHGFYLAMEKRKAVQLNEHCAPLMPYAIADILQPKLDKSMTVFIRWSIATYRWSLHTFQHTSSSRIGFKKKNKSNHRHFVRNEEKTLEELQQYTNEHLKEFELIFLDGPDKAEEVALLLPMLKENGIVVAVDDFVDPYNYEQTLEAFKAAGFKVLQLTNPAPMFDTLSGAIIYKDDNWLDL